jgi:hypothetical protein
MGRRKVVTPGVEIEWDDAALHEFLNNPAGPLGVELMTRIGEVVAEGARHRQRVRTGNAQKHIGFRVVEVDIDGETVPAAEIYSGARDEKNNFPYPIVHEGAHPRDRRPHRALRPSLRDIRKLSTVEEIADPAPGA